MNVLLTPLLFVVAAMIADVTGSVVADVVRTRLPLGPVSGKAISCCASASATSFR